MEIIKGHYNNAKVFCNSLDVESINQIRELLNINVFENSIIRIMPDAHKGAGCVIGFTATISNKIIPNLVGVDIGCGMLTINLGKNKINLEKLDNFIYKNIPHGFAGNKKISSNIPKDLIDEIQETCKNIKESPDAHFLKLGSLGGGNHFIEIDIDDEENKYLIIHTGSRNFGLKIANYYQNLAYDYCKNKKIKLSKSLCYLDNKQAEQYKKDMKIAQYYAKINRYIIAKRITEFLDIIPLTQFETIHNYINFEDNIIRKGAVSARYNELILIPLNMKEGCIIAKGKGNKDWNYSAPHGAGRKFSRTQAKKLISLEEFQNSMKGIYSTSINHKTVDESPMAYKNSNEIISSIKETVEIIKLLKPIYNFKSE